MFDLQYFFDEWISLNKYINFIKEISEGYYRDKSPYHNDIHAADVLQTVYVIMEKSGFFYKLDFTELDYISLLLSAICHDYKHPGIGNSYIINSLHKLTIQFNGKK